MTTGKKKVLGPSTRQSIPDSHSAAMANIVTLKGGREVELSTLSSRPEFIEVMAPLMFNQWRSFWVNAGKPTLQHIIEHLQSAKGPDSIPYYVVAHIGKEVIAFAGIDVNEREGDERTPWLVDVLILPKYRGSGIFRALLLNLMKREEARGTKKMWLWTKQNLKPLFMSLGWEFEGDELWQTEDKGMSPNPVLSLTFPLSKAKL